MITLLEPQNENHKNNISTLQFYKYKLNIRDGFNPCLNLEKIVKQFIVDQWVKIEGSRLYYYRSHQAYLRTEMYTGNSSFRISNTFKS